MSRLRVALLGLMVAWAVFDAFHAEPVRWLQVAEDAAWIGLIVFWPQARDRARRVAAWWAT